MKRALYILGDMAHALQKERGCISMFLCSEGKLFYRRMNTQFAESEAALRAFAEGLENWQGGGLKQAQTDKLKALLSLCNKLPKMRELVLAQKISVSKIIDHYAHNLVNPLLQTMVEIALFMEGHNPTFVSAYNAFLQWKESIGLERSISAKGFVNHSFHNSEFLERVLFLLSDQRNYRKTYMALANDAQKQLVQNVLDGEASTELRKLHQMLADSLESSELYDLTPESWFNLITTKIDALQTIEKQLVDTLSHNETSKTSLQVKHNLPKGNFGKYDNIISSLKLFSGLTANNLDSILSHGQIRDYHKGKLLFLEGEQSNRLYIILQGWVKIFKGTADGEETTLQMLSSGDSIMESAVFLNTPFPVNAQIAEDAVMLSIPAPIIREQVKNNNDLAINLLTSMSYRSQGLIRQIEDARLKSVDERIGWFLLRLLLEQGHISRCVTLPYDKSLIASYLDMKRETFSRSLKRLKQKGFQVENDTIIIPNLASLCGFCDSDTAHICSKHNTPDCPNPSCDDLSVECA